VRPLALKLSRAADEWRPPVLKLVSQIGLAPVSPITTALLFRITVKSERMGIRHLQSGDDHAPLDPGRL
jgi:hypothetical protein